MAGKSRLTAGEISEQLKGLPEWALEHSNRAIQKTFVRQNFVDAVAFIQAIVPIAERNDHHPDILLSGYKNVKVMLSTHSAGGITQKDFDLAREIDRLP